MVVVVGKCSASVAVAAEVGVEQVMIHIGTENHMTGKNCNEKVFVALAVVEHLDKMMIDVAAVDWHRTSHHYKIENYYANVVAEVEKPFYPSGS